jgi:hypothetical protein
MCASAMYRYIWFCVFPETPDALGKDVFWWEPAVTGPLGLRGVFDEKGNALPVIIIFDKLTRH